MRVSFLLLGFACLLALACDRNIEPAVPGEQPREPDLSRIFPAGAEEQPPMGGAPMGGSPSGGRGAAPIAGAAPAAGSESITGTIRVAPEFEGRVPAGAILFIVARPFGAQGGPPLAVKRLSASDLPVDFEIGPADVMIPTMQFAGQIGLSARIDSDGNAISRQPGDLSGSVDAPLAPGAKGVEIVIDEAL